MTIPLTDTWILRLLRIAIALIILNQLGAVIASLFGGTGILVTTLILVAVAFASLWLARTKFGKKTWYLLPALVFTVVPVAIKTWQLFAGEGSVFHRISVHGSIYVGFVIPVLVLLAVHGEMQKRIEEDKQPDS